jgi:beta-galactosidase
MQSFTIVPQGRTDRAKAQKFTCSAFMGAFMNCRRVKSFPLPCCSILCLLGYVLWAGMISGMFAQQTSKKTLPPTPSLWLGTAWYPEQWPEARWNADLDLMQKAGIRFVRIGEFAWSTLEPTEGDYHLGWLERAINDAGQHGIYTVVGTPSAAPPAWLTQKYPETLRIEHDGRLAQHGNRQQFNWDNPKYRELARDIASRMAQRVGHNPYVIGWQIDNEYANVSFDPQTRGDFQAWLKHRYGTLDNMNTRWTTSYWSQTYSNWNQIPIEENKGNPGLLLSWKRFVSDTWRSYQKNQLDVIRQYADPGQFITTNMMGWFQGYNHYTVAQDLDLASWDDYIGEGHLNAFVNGSTDDLTRGFKQKNFWVMETEPAFVNWRPTNTPLKKGQVRDMAWQAIGHGAETVEYWQWRSAPNGQEEYHGVLVGADGTPVPVYYEVKQAAEEFAKAGPQIAGTSPHSEVALVNDYDSRWAIDFQRHSAAFDPVAEMLAFYRPLREQSQAVDVISINADLSPYKVVELPALNVMSQSMADHLMAYVRSGGHLLLGPRTGMKDEFNALQPERQPGPLAGFLGGRVDQFYAVDTNIPVSGELGSGTANIWAEQLQVQSPDTKVLMRYGKSNGWLDDQPAVITRPVGKGSITYVGAWLDGGTLDRLTARLLDEAGVKAIIPNVPESVEVCRRSGHGKSVLILINHNTREEDVTLPSPMRDLIGRQGAAVASVHLPGYGVAVLEAVK